MYFEHYNLKVDLQIKLKHCTSEIYNVQIDKPKMALIL